MQDLKREQFAYWVTIPTRWGEMDALGHINHAMYFRYLEEGRTGWIAKMCNDYDGLWEKEGLILADIQCSYIRQLRHPVTVEVGTRIVKIGKSSMTIQGAVFVEGEGSPAAVSRGIVVWFDYASQKTAPVPDWLRQRIRDVEPVAPEE
mgnify:CR=1 FL=1